MYQIGRIVLHVTERIEGHFSSKYIGVDQRKTGGKFRAAIVYDGENIHIGVFTKEIDAHKAYQDALCKINSGSFDPITYRKAYQ